MIPKIRIISNPEQKNKGRIIGQGWEIKCALGKTGILINKKEGDGATPKGTWHPKKLWFRADKTPYPKTPLPKKIIKKTDGWCDAPTHASYNKPIQRPFSASHEILWRNDGCYDYIIELNHNTNPALPHKGSAIFIHIARDNFSPTEGCIALRKSDMKILLHHLSQKTQIKII